MLILFTVYKKKRVSHSAWWEGSFVVANSADSGPIIQMGMRGKRNSHLFFCHLTNVLFVWIFSHQELCFLISFHYWAETLLSSLRDWMLGLTKYLTEETQPSLKKPQRLHIISGVGMWSNRKAAFSVLPVLKVSCPSISYTIQTCWNTHFCHWVFLCL